MGGSTSCDDLVSVSIGFRSCVYSLNCEELCVKHEQTFYGNMKKDVKEIFLEDLESSNSKEEEDFNDSTVKQLGISLCETLQIHDPPEPMYVRSPTSNVENIYNQSEVKPLSFDTGVLGGLNLCATILSSELVQSYQTTTKLIPALKGSRTKHGMHLDAKLSVKWAPEVYDPPATSSSHTVKGHQHRHHHHHSKAKKDYHNHKYIKGKASRGSVIERKYAHRRSSGSNLTYPRVLRLQALGSNRSQPLLNSCGHAKIEPLDLLAVGSRESVKYGSSCYRKLLAPVQLPLAKAS